jgi:hypothetical protein
MKRKREIGADDAEWTNQYSNDSNADWNSKSAPIREIRGKKRIFGPRIQPVI